MHSSGPSRHVKVFLHLTVPHSLLGLVAEERLHQVSVILFLASALSPVAGWGPRNFDLLRILIHGASWLLTIWASSLDAQLSMITQLITVVQLIRLFDSGTHCGQFRSWRDTAYGW